MNKNLEQLVNQCWTRKTVRVWDEETNAYYPRECMEIDEKKLAQLVAKECVLVARKAEAEDRVYSSWAIEQHFGLHE